MNARTWTFAVLLALPLRLAAEPEIEFAGVMRSRSELCVALTDRAAGRAVQWVPIGGRFAGYTVSTYDSVAEVVLLTKGGQRTPVPLRQSRTRSAEELRPSPDIERMILGNLSQLASAAEHFFLEHGKTAATYEDLVGWMKYLKHVIAVDGENYRALQFAPGKPLVVMTSAGFPLVYPL